jgi:4'-phosphopantetheinyl transferase
MIEVYAIKLDEDDHFESRKKELLRNLPEESCEAEMRHKTVKGAQRTLLGELISRKMIGKKIGIPSQEIHFMKTTNGKPYLDNSSIKFNVSHSGEWVALAMANIDVGIDVEKFRKVNFNIATRFFSIEENELLEKLEGADKIKLFFDFWTLKESYLKLLGTGLTKSLSSFSIVRDSKNFKLKENSVNKQEPVYFRQYPLAADYKLSVCSFGNDFINEHKIITVKDLIDDF